MESWAWCDENEITRIPWFFDGTWPENKAWIKDRIVQAATEVNKLTADLLCDGCTIPIKLVFLGDFSSAEPDDGIKVRWGSVIGAESGENADFRPWRFDELTNLPNIFHFISLEINDRILAGTITIKHDRVWFHNGFDDPNTMPQKFDPGLVALHEFGHALGIDDLERDGRTSASVGDVMNGDIGIVNRDQNGRLDNYLPEIGDFPFNNVFFQALQGKYGNLVNSQCGLFELPGYSWHFHDSSWPTPNRFKVVHTKSLFDGCVGVCTAPQAFAAGVQPVLAYELAVSSDGGPFTTYATLSEGDWINGRYYEHRFFEDIPQASFRIRAFENGVLVDEQVDGETFDILAASDLRIDPKGPFLVHGEVGGPFSPQCSSVALHNAGVTDLTWSSSCATGWITVSPANGSLAPNETLTIAMCLTDLADTLPVGDFAGHCAFTNNHDEFSQERTIALSVIQCPPTAAIEGTALDFVAAPGATAVRSISVENQATQSCANLAFDISTSTPDAAQAIDTVGGVTGRAGGINRNRGNIYEAVQRTRLTKLESYLEFTGTRNLTFTVMEGDTPSGPFAQAVSQTVSRTGTGAGFYSSNALNVALTAGKFYVMAVGWNGDSVLYYFDNTPAPHAVSFGRQLGGFAADVYPLTSPIVAGLQPGNYYQRVSTSDSWLSVSPSSGSVAPGFSESVEVIADSTGLAEGEYTGSLDVSTSDPTQPLVAIPVTMTVGVDALSVAPDADFATAGPVGGPFTPTCAAYTLHNNGASPLTWVGSCSEPWVEVTPPSGSVPAHSSVTVQLCTNGSTAGLPLETYSANCSFENQSFGSSYSRAVRLEVSVCTDQDGDGYSTCAGDCLDTNPGVHPGVVESCDGVDNDCDGAADENFGVRVGCAAGVGSCVRSGHIVCAADQHSTICDAAPGSPVSESCNSADDDCDGQIDDGIYCDCVPFRDDFNGQLQPGWTWVRENPATWSLAGRPGWLAIDMEYGDLWQGTNNSRNTLLRPAPAGNFRIETLLEFDLRANINQAHILLYQTDNHYVRLGPVRSGGGLFLDMVHELGGGIASQIGRGISTNRLYLRIDRVGSVATLSYSSDGAAWSVHAVIANLQFNPTYVGVVAFDGSEPQSASMAWYDYFQVLPAASCSEVCNGVDDDLDGAVDEDPTGAPLTRSCFTGPAGTNGVGLCHGGIATCVGGNFGACQGEVIPTTETCNGVDDDCDGQVDEELARTSCGVGGCQRSTENCVDGVPQTCVPGAPTEESCNGVDDDCDGLIDEDFDFCSCHKHVYTSDEDFDQGRLVSVNHDVPARDQLQLNSTTSTFPFIWMAISGRGTVVKVNTETGLILGEFQTGPDGRGRNPSRTTVDFNGNVWTGNRDEESGGRGSVVQLGLLENNQCVDRNGNGVIDTSTGLGDVRPWSNPGGIDDNGGVASAEDECVIHYVRVDGDGIRHLSVDANNNVWVGGSLSGSDNAFNLLNGSTGQILAGFNVGGGGYGGLVDRNGILWSAGREPGSPNVLLRYDTKNSITTSDDTWSFLNSPLSYGVAIDPSGNVWNTHFLYNSISKFDPSGNRYTGFPKGTGGGSYDRGVAVTPDGDVWVANSGGADVSRLGNNGILKMVIPLGEDGFTPTGVAVDTAGKVWVTCYSSHTAKRIDPATNSVDLTISLGANAYPYNYSDMTGFLARSATSPRGTWTVVHDSGRPATAWGIVRWDGDEPSGTQVSGRVRSAETIAGLGAATYVSVANGLEFDAASGRYLEVEVKLTPDSSGVSPIVYSVTVEKKATCSDPCTPTGPTDEVCNGVDDDCDGWVDEDYAPTSTTCGVGTCASTGVASCISGQVVDSCDARTAAADTTCDSVDDDCDGATDEEYAAVATTCGMGACGSVGETSCIGGQVHDSCLPRQPAPNDATCDGLDDDCDGVADEDFVSTAVSCGIGACLSTGETRCFHGQVVDLCYPGVSSAEGCDGLDNDCDGATDEDLGTATCGVGACVRTVDNCSGGRPQACVPGPPDVEQCNGADDDCNGIVDDGGIALCDDSDPCTDDSCDLNLGCRNVPNGLCEVSPKTQGFWRRLCSGPHPDGSITQADVACVNDSCTFASVHTLAELCDRLTPNPSNDKCEQAESQFMALMLNHCQNRLTDLAPIVSQCTSHTTVGPSRAEAGALLCSGTRTQATCTLAQCESEELNSGSALLTNSLRLARLPDGSPRLTWNPPYGISDLGPPHAYVVRRRESSETAYQQVASTQDLWFVDTTAPGGSFYEYDVTPVW